MNLLRTTSLAGAVLLGLGATIGTGAYISIALAAETTGAWVLIAIGIAALVALCNGLSSAQLAAVHPVSGGTYEYGYQFLNHWFGFTAGWLFVAAKSASAATAVLAVGLYLLPAIGWPIVLQRPLAWVLLAVLMVLVNRGVRRSNQVNLFIVTASIGALLVFCVHSLGLNVSSESASLTPALTPDLGDASGWREVLAAAALVFVAFTGYGRIATMGEEVKNPRITIPAAILVTVVVTTLLYILIGFTLAQRGFHPQENEGALALVAMTEHAGIQAIVLAGALIALVGVTLNLILGVSRVVLAMGRRGDLPHSMARLSNDRSSAPNAVYLTVAVMALLVVLGGVHLAWSFSAFTVLTYYGITNLAALKVSNEHRFVPRFVSVVGLISCLGLVFFIQWQIFIGGVAFIIAGLIWHGLRHKNCNLD